MTNPASLRADSRLPEAASKVSRPKSNFFNRELSWIGFNRRVLEEALDTRNPLLERVKFLAIFSSNLDEFFMIRVGGIKQQIAAGVQKSTPDGLTPREQLVSVRRVVVPILEEAQQLFSEELLPALADQGIYLLEYDQLERSQRDALAEYFDRQVFPVLTPLAFDPSHPFPHISNLSLNLAVVIDDPVRGELFARVKVPEGLPRLVPLPVESMPETLGSADCAIEAPPDRRRYFVWLERLIAAHLPALFPGVRVVESYSFRVTRNADMDIEEDEAADLLLTIEQGVRNRRFGRVVRLTVDEAMPARVRQLLMVNLKVDVDDVDALRMPQGISGLMPLTNLDRPDLKDPPILPSIPAALSNPPDIFTAVRQQDILFHHPYDSFTPVVDFIRTAAKDPNVLAIKQTLYRVGNNSPIVKALMHARENGKQVTVLVELKARFDEQNNITWARALERQGVHVVYGLLGLKTHTKMALVVRNESDGLRRYVHLGTGNYNVTTAKTYTDFGLLTARPEMGADASELFNFLTGHSRQTRYRKLLVAPITLRDCFSKLIEREAKIHERQGGGRLIFKMNAILDTQMIETLYRASQAGVEIDLIARGMCRLRPGVPGLSESIRVRSIVGRYLEHSRIYYFNNGGDEQIYLGSADLMERNLNRRVETLFPLEDRDLVHQVRDSLLETYLSDNFRARVLMPDGTYVRLSPGPDEKVVDSQDLA